MERRRLLASVRPFYLIAPSLGVICLLLLFPVGYSIWISFFAKHGLYPIEDFVGWKNYIYLLRDDPLFWISVKNTLFFVTATISAQFGLGMGTALLLNQSIKGRAVFRGMILFPYVIPTVVSVFLWRWILNDTYGILNHILLQLNIIRTPIVWLGKSYVMLSLIVVSTWRFFPFVVICLLGRLQTIDPSLYDAAKIDGTSPIQSFIHITLPQMRNTILVVLVMRGMWMFTKFDVVWLMSGVSSLSRYVETLPVYAYRLSFVSHQIGLGSAVSVMSFATLVITVTIILLKMYQREVSV